ncbi:hypothetical protein Acr_11g0000040 [Actinidia rufa]|uniref:Uncharacterized protein n=1 Tax=Actinidia rufa TaxID=165716 RepID=A0A7J0FAH0_9ERIC|nr:hypothetical protein Acr_11g0000040 [Actinidia rufa]
MIEAKEIASTMEIEPVFIEKHVIRRKKQFDENVGEEASLSSEESFRVNYFLFVVDKALSSLESRFKQFQRYEKIWGFLFDVKKLNALIGQCLLEHCTKLEDVLKHEGQFDIDEKDLFSELKILKDCLPRKTMKPVVIEIWASNQQSILLGFLGTGPRTIKGRHAQTNENKQPGRGRSKPLRRGGQTNVMTADGVMGRVRGSRRDPRKDERESRKGQFPCIERILVEMEILSTLPRPRARRRQYFGSGRSDEYFEGGSGELSGDDLARSHGLVLPRSRGFGDRRLAF